MNDILSYHHRHAISVSSAVLLTLVANYFLFENQGYWMVIAAFLVSPVTRGTVLKQGIVSLLISIVAILLSSVLVSKLKNTFILDVIAAICFVPLAIFIFNQKIFSYRYFHLGIIFIFAFMIETYAPVPPWYTLESRVYHVALGGLIGICCGLFIFPTRIANDFKLGLLPALYASKHYLNGLTNCFVTSEPDTHVLLSRRTQLENTLLPDVGIYPNWVYEKGFNPGLRAGFRFFLIEIERIAEILFSMSDLITRHKMEAVPSELALLFQEVSLNNSRLIDILINYFESHFLNAKEHDFTHDIEKLEVELKRVLPHNLELVDLIPDYIVMIAFAKKLREIRKMLLQLVMAVANKKN